jgi:predicted urease superfamily metal-dependent hydrolase
MPLRPEVRDAQRTLATLDATHRRAVDRLNQALGRRSELIAEQDRHVASAQTEVDKAVVAMASEVSVELTAHLLDLEVADVRRLVKARSAAGTHRPNPFGNVK